MSTNKTATQQYKVMSVEKDFEIRYYPSTTIATISSSAKTYQELSNSGFTKLAGYIFGGNKENKQIAMTSPVHMDINDTNSTMSFVMPDEFTKDNLPLPNTADITIKTVPEEYVAVVSFAGFATHEIIKLYSTNLERKLKENHISYFGNFRFLGYNPPYQLFGRRNEIIVTIDKNQIIKM
jgi:hypothetical protein